MADELVCPSCGALHSTEERFCRDCGMPLVAPGTLGVDQPVGELHARARKVKPQYTEGEAVRVVGASHQAEAEFIQGLLLEEGIPSMTKRAAGVDVPDMLAAGRRDVLVPRSGLAAARDVLLQAEILRDTPARPVDPPWRILGGLLGGLVVLGIIIELAGR